MFQPTITDPRTREGELLWQSRMDEAAVRAQEEFLGDYGTAGQLQQRPVPRGGGIVKEEHFRFWRRGNLPNFDFQAISVDAAFKEKQDSSYVVIQAWGRDPPHNYLLDQIRERMSFTKTLERILEMKRRFPKAGVVLIEDKANGPAIIDVLKRGVPGVLPELPTGSKEARAEAAAPLIQAGNVVIPHPDEAPWSKIFMMEWMSVPNGAFWDQVDASDQYLNKFGRAMKATVSGGSLIIGGDASAGVANAVDSPWNLGSPTGSPWA